MDSAKGALSAQEMEKELAQMPVRAPTMGHLAKVSYSHQAMIDLIISSPGISQGQLAAHFGYTPGWISNIMASDAFKVALSARREEIVDPVIKATIAERVEGMVIQSLEVLREKLDQPGVPSTVALRAFELGAKAMGLGGNAQPAPQAPAADRLERLANRLIDLQSGVRERVVQGTAVRVVD